MIDRLCRFIRGLRTSNEIRQITVYHSLNNEPALRFLATMEDASEIGIGHTSHEAIGRLIHNRYPHLVDQGDIWGQRIVEGPSATNRIKKMVPKHPKTWGRKNFGSFSANLLRQV